jgi:hypothetical protein
VLVEAGMLTLEAVEEHLSAHLHIPTAPSERLEQPDPEALEAISADLVRRHRMFPMWLEKQTLHVAMSDPRDPNAIDQLAFATSLSIQPYVVAELRLVQLLEQYYEIRPNSRFTDYHLLEVAGHVQNSRRQRPSERRQIERRNQRPSADTDETEQRRSVLGIRPLEEGEELSRREDFRDWGTDANPEVSGTDAAAVEATGTPSPESPMGAPPARSTAEISELESELVLLATPGAVPSLVLRIGVSYARAVAFLAVRRDQIRVLLTAGEMAGIQVEGSEFAASAQGMLSGPVSTGKVFRGLPASEGVDRDLLELLQREPRELAVFPIRIAERTVSLLYVDNGDAALAATSIAALEALCEITTAAYDRLLLESQRYIGFDLISTQ